MKKSIWLVALFGTVLMAHSVFAQTDAPPPPPPTPEAGTTDGAATGVSATSLPDGESERSAKNSIWLEGLGSGMLYSINYERMVIDDLGVRLGFSYLSFGASASMDGDTVEAKAKVFIFPITASYVGISSASKKHCLELGGGFTLMFASAAMSGGGMSADGAGAGGFGEVLAGYRLQPADGGFQFRVGLMALLGPGLGMDVEDPTAFGVLPWGYISLGGTF